MFDERPSLSDIALSLMSYRPHLPSRMVFRRHGSYWSTSTHSFLAFLAVTFPPLLYRVPQRNIDHRSPIFDPLLFPSSPDILFDNGTPSTRSSRTASDYTLQSVDGCPPPSDPAQLSWFLTRYLSPPATSFLYFFLSRFPVSKRSSL